MLGIDPYQLREAECLFYSHASGAGSATAAAQSNDIKGHAIQDGGMTPALPQSNPRPPAYSAAGVLRQPDFGLQEASSSGQPNRNVPAGLEFAYSAAPDWISE